MHFMGIDLAWKAEPPWESNTGVCILNTECEIEDLFLLASDSEILSTIDDYEELWVGIDAPLFVPEKDDLRNCESELFSRGIRLFPTNRNFMNRKFGGCRGERLRKELLSMGFSLPGSKEDRRLYEVYPYGALSVLTGGDVPRYKKGPADEKRRAANSVLNILRQWTSVDAHQLEKEIASSTPGELVGVMDKLDALLSVLCVYTHWLYDSNRTDLVGGEQDGYILLPHYEVCQ